MPGYSRACEASATKPSDYIRFPPPGARHKSAGSYPAGMAAAHHTAAIAVA
jgi:hypothetical protein